MRLFMILPFFRRQPTPTARSPETAETIRHLRTQRALSLAETRRLRRIDLAELIAAARDKGGGTT